MFIRPAFSGLFLAVSALAAFAASPEEAARVKSLLESYFGAEPGVVQVSVVGNGYAITLDAMPYIKKLEGPEFKAYVEPLSISAEPQGNGQWKVSGSGPWGFQFQAPGKVEMAARAAGQDWTGVFDETLGGFSSSTATYSGVTFSQKTFDPSLNANLNLSYAIQSITSTAGAVSDGNGGTDSTIRFEAKGITVTTATEGDAGANAPALAAMNYSAIVGALTYDTAAKGLRNRAILDLVAWFIAHSSKDAIIRDQSQLKEKLVNALPVFKAVESKAVYQDMNIATVFGNFGLPAVSAEVNMNGAVKDGFMQQRFSLKDFAIPAGLLPQWSQQLVPTNLNVDFALTGFDLDAPARNLLAQLDLSKEPPLPPGTEQLLLPALVPTNALKLTFGKNEMSSPIYAIAYDGVLDISLAGLPTGKFNAKVKGLDAVIATVQTAAADPLAQQSLAGLIAAKGLGKAEPDGSVSYAIDLQPMGQVFVNGVNVTAMAGGPPPAPAQ
jgi:hypothetical protein